MSVSALEDVFIRSVEPPSPARKEMIDKQIKLDLVYVLGEKVLKQKLSKKLSLLPKEAKDAALSSENRQ